MNRDVTSGGLTSAPGRPVRRGFTLVEVVVAAAILMILMIALMGSFSAGVAGFKKAQIETLAQNLAEFQAEDLKSMAPSVLNHLVQGTYPGDFYKFDSLGNPVYDASGNPVIDTENPLIKYSNYPPAVGPGNPGYNADAYYNDNSLLDSSTPGNSYMYDSGEVQTDYNLIGVTKVSGSPWVAGDTPSSAPVIPDGTFLLGTSVEILPYADSGTTWKYYRVVLHKEAYPLFTKRIRVERINAARMGQPTDPAYHDYNSDSGTVFAYTITIRFKQGNAVPVLYSTSGTIASPYAVESTTIGVTAPTMPWTKGQSYTVTWTVSGDVSGIYAYRISFSSDDGHGFGAPLAVILYPGLTATITASSVDTDTAIIKVDAVSSSGRIIASDQSPDFVVGAYVPPGPGPLTVTVDDPKSLTVWTAGASQTVGWSVGGTDATLDGFEVALSTNGGGSFVNLTTTDKATRTAMVTAGAASTACVIRVTAVNGSAGAIVSDSSPAFTTQLALKLTVLTPVESAAFTVGDTIYVTWSLNRVEPSITSYEIIVKNGSTTVLDRTDTSGTSFQPTTKGAYTVTVNAKNGAGSVVVAGSSSFTVNAQFSITVGPISTQKKKQDFQLSWTTNGDATSVTGYSVQLSMDNKATWTAATATALPGASTANLSVPNSTSDHCYVRVVSSGVVYTATSNEFKITPSGN
jgi:type II secretory pathway pseudopilin PulG